MRNESNRAVELSAAGAERREAILALGLRAMRRRTARRIAARGAGSIAVATALIAAVVWSRRPDVDPVVPLPQDALLAERDVPAPSRHGPDSPSVVVIATGSEVPICQVARPNASLVQVIEDDQLLDVLAQANRPAALLERDGEQVVMFW